MTEGGLWICPRCGRGFARSGQTHACGRFSVQAHLAGRPAAIVELYRALIRLARAVGPLRLAPTRTRIGLQNRRIFAAVNRLSDDYLDIHLVTSVELSSPRIRRPENPAPGCFVHHLRLRSARDLDRELQSWLRLAYAWGLGETTAGRTVGPVGRRVGN